MANKTFVERVELEIEHVIMKMGYVALGDDYQIIKKASAEIEKMVEKMLPGFGEIAVLMHDYYEEAAKEVGWKTQEGCSVPFNDLPEKNKQVMLKVADRLRAELRKRLNNA